MIKEKKNLLNELCNKMNGLVKGEPSLSLPMGREGQKPVSQVPGVTVRRWASQSAL